MSQDRRPPAPARPSRAPERPEGAPARPAGFPERPACFPERGEAARGPAPLAGKAPGKGADTPARPVPAAGPAGFAEAPARFRPAQALLPPGLPAGLSAPVPGEEAGPGPAFGPDPELGIGLGLAPEGRLAAEQRKKLPEGRLAAEEHENIPQAQENLPQEQDGPRVAPPAPREAESPPSARSAPAVPEGGPAARPAPRSSDGMPGGRAASSAPETPARARPAPEGRAPGEDAPAPQPRNPLADIRPEAAVLRGGAAERAGGPVPEPVPEPLLAQVLPLPPAPGVLGGFAGVTPGLLSGRRVLIIVENLPVPFDRRVWLEARTLQAAGAVVSVICPLGPGAQARYECLEGIHVHRHPLTQARGPAGYAREYAEALFWQWRLAWRVFRTEGFDTLQGCNPPDLICLVALPFRLLGRAYVFDHHDLSPELFDAKFPAPRGRLARWLHRLARRGLSLAERLSFASADMVISTNESYRRIARTRGRKGPGQVVVVRSGPDLARVRPMPPDPRWKAGRRHLVGYVGVMGAQEGLDLLLEAARHLVFDRGRRDVQFCLAGDGPERPALEALARELGLSGHVTFPGRLPDADLFEMLSTADLCVNPDRVTPMNDLSTMNKILEYMALSRPIVQFEVTEGRVSAGDAALYARPDDARDFAACMLTLLRDPALRARMGAIGRRRVETRFAWEHEAGRLVEAYRRLAPRGARRGSGRG